MPDKPNGVLMPYSMCFDSTCDGCARIDSVREDATFAEVVAAALRSHPAAPPSAEPPLTNALQGNLCEFCAWDVGELSWQLFEREFTWTANASSPWRLSSDPGIDILALNSREEDPILLVIEVKSSVSGGSGSVTGDGSTLQTDFRHLFSDDDRSRLKNRVGAVLADLILKTKRPDLAGKVKKAVGRVPSGSSGVKLIAVLICKRGNNRSKTARAGHFQELQAWLLSQGWSAGQIECRCIEINDFSKWLGEVIRKAIHDHD